MGTNFYFQTKNKEIINKYAPYTYKLVDEPEFAYEIHVAKTSMGWLPLFQAHENGIKSVKEYREFYDTGEVRIFDEYGTEYNWDEFDKRVLQFNGGKIGIVEPEKIINKSNDKYMPEYRPISHIPGNKQSYKYMFASDTKTMLTDDEGYEFEECEFS